MYLRLPRGSLTDNKIATDRDGKISSAGENCPELVTESTDNARAQRAKETRRNEKERGGWLWVEEKNEGEREGGRIFLVILR